MHWALEAHWTLNRWWVDSPWINLHLIRLSSERLWTFQMRKRSEQRVNSLVSGFNWPHGMSHIYPHFLRSLIPADQVLNFRSAENLFDATVNVVVTNCPESTFCVSCVPNLEKSSLRDVLVTNRVTMNVSQMQTRHFLIHKAWGFLHDHNFCVHRPPSLVCGVALNPDPESCQKACQGIAFEDGFAIPFKKQPRLEMRKCNKG